MADDDYGAAQPIADVFRGAYKKANDLYHLATGSDISTDAGTDAGKKVDPTWHTNMVKQANDSFAKQQQIPTQTKAQKRPVVAAKIQVKTSVKPGPQKQAGGK